MNGKKVIKLALYNRASGAQGCTYYGTQKYVYAINDLKEFKLPRNEKEFKALKERGIISLVQPTRTKTLFSSSSASGGIFEDECIEYYEVEAPVLLKIADIYEGKWSYSYELISEDINEERKPEYDRPFASVVEEAEVIDNRSGIPIEELKKLNCRFIGATRDTLHGDDFDEFELENGCTATLFYRRTMSADVGYRFDYTKLLRIYPPPRK
ncbi:MAG: hypothetical protein QXT28_06250 [Thermofilaceae archaeon]